MFNFSKNMGDVFAKISQWARGLSLPSASKPLEEVWTPQKINISSSYVKWVLYDPSSRKLSVNYLGKKTCTYSNISAQQFANFMNSSSKGTWARTYLFSRSYT